MGSAVRARRGGIEGPVVLLQKDGPSIPMRSRTMKLMVGVLSVPAALALVVFASGLLRNHSPVHFGEERYSADRKYLALVVNRH
jgi:hypothetical protein